MSTVVTNLPVIQPVLRRVANNIGLSILFSRSGGKSTSNGANGASGKSYPLASNLQQSGVHATGYGRGDKSRNAREANTTTIAAWDSDEHVLLEASGGKSVSTSEITSGKENGILVGTEVTIMREDLEPAKHKRELGSAMGRSSPASDTWTRRNRGC